jgi:hypothetical protein
MYDGSATAGLTAEIENGRRALAIADVSSSSTAGVSSLDDLTEAMEEFGEKEVGELNNEFGELIDELGDSAGYADGSSKTESTAVPGVGPGEADKS